METIKYHNHHITPKSLLKHKSKEFINDKCNIVRVTVKQHIALHKWLFMLTGHPYCESAYYSMKTGKFIFFKHTPESINKMIGSNNPMYGIKHSEKTKQLQSELKRGKNNPFYNKKFSPDHLKNLSIAKSGKNHPLARTWLIFGKIFNTSKDAGDCFGVYRTTILRWCNTKLPHCRVL